jgi:hypothetical protein
MKTKSNILLTIVLFIYYGSLGVSSFTLFQTNNLKTISTTKLHSSSTVTYFDDLVKAVKASTTFGLYDPDTLHELADKVEAGADSCMFEPDQTELCQKEIDDRLDVAEVLRMQAELILRMEAIEGSSLFADDCLAEDAIRQREELMDYLEEDSF